MSGLRSTRLSSFGVAALLFHCALSAAGATTPAAKDAKSKVAPVVGAGARANAAQRALPLVFEENAGQLPAGTVFAGHTANYTVDIQPSALRFGLSGKGKTRTVALSFTGHQDAKAEGVSEAGFRTNFYLSRDPRNWHTDVRNFNRVALRGLYQGIDAEFYSAGSEIEHDFFVAPGADAGQLLMHLSGAKTAAVSQAGDVVLSAEEGALKLRKPLAYQTMADGSRHLVNAEFVLTATQDGSDLAFKLGEYDHSRELVIDPVITYATYVAGDQGSTPTAVTSDSAGNVYITGTTTSTSTTFGSTATPTVSDGLDPATAPSASVTFIARLSRATTGTTPAPVNGSQIAWLTYYGDGATPAAVSATAIALQASTVNPTLYIAGQTTSTALPGATTHNDLSTGTSVYGFVARFKSTDGTAASANNATYVDGGSQIPGLTIGNTPILAVPAQGDRTTLLNAISVDAGGAVSVVGSTNGAQYNATLTLTGTDVPSDFCSGNGNTGDQERGLLVTFPAGLGTPTYSSYVCGYTPGTVNTDTFRITGVSATTGTATSTYLISGYTDLDFPLSGTYPVAATDGTDFFHTGASKVPNAFAASFTHTASANTVDWSYWSAGDAADHAMGLAVDTSSTPATVVVFGDTRTASFTTKSEVSNASAATPTANTTTGYNTYNGNGQKVGFAVSLSAVDGSFNGITLLQGDGANSTTVNAAVADRAGNVLLTGYTNGTKASFPEIGSTDPLTPGSSARPATVNTLPGAEDLSLDPAVAGGTYTNGYLVSMPETLLTTDYVAFFGPAAAAGASSGVGVAIDAIAADNSSLPGTASSPLAYVLLSETTGSSHSFTTSSAEEQVPQTGATNAAYLAQVGFVAATATPSFTYSPVGDSTHPPDGTYTPNPVGYSTDAESSLTLKWTVHVADAGTSQLVFNLPQTPYLPAYTLSELSVTIGTGSNVAAADCTLGVGNAVVNPPASSTAAGPGITCVIPAVAAATGGTAVVFQLAGGQVTSAVPTGVSSFMIGAAAYDATGNSADLTQTITTAGVPTLSVAVTAAPATVNAATSATQTDATDNPVTVTYTYTISNSSDYDSPQTSLVTNLNTTTAGRTLLSNPTVTSTGCDPTTATNGCDVPAHGSLVYTVTGVYLDTNFTGVTSFPYTVTQGVPYVTFSSPQTNEGEISATSPGPSVNVNGVTTVTANAITTNQPTYANHTSFQLGDQDVELTASFTNSGNNPADSYTATVTLPQGYTATASNCTGATAPYTSCTFDSIAPGQTASFTITGRFDDTGASTDAVAGPMMSAAPTAASVIASPTNNTVTTSISTVSSGVHSGTYVTSAPLPAATSIKVTRVNALTDSISAATPIAANTLNELGPLHATYTNANDTLSYTATVTNTGTSVARGIYFTIPVPNTPSGTVPVVTLAAPTYSTGLSAANQLSCSYVSAQNAIVCYENDLKTGAALPTTTPHPTVTPQTYTITFTTSYDETAVPQNVKSTQVTQGNGTIFADADTYNVAAGLGIPASVTTPGASTGTNVITIQRLTSITSSASVAAVGAAGANYADTTHITLDSNPAGSAPGTFDTLLYQSSTSNMGPNDAAGLTISIPLPALTRVAVPQYCTLNGVTGPSTSLVTLTAATTMTCATPAIATVASSTATNQLRPAASACPAATAPTGAALSAVTFDPNGNCFSVAFYAKFSDAATTTGTVVGANATGAVSYSATGITENDVDTPSTPAPAASAAVTTVQRAAHLRLSAPVSTPTYTTGAVLSTDGSGHAEAAQAALHMDPVTRQVTSGKVYDCLRYTISVVNEGPNIVLTPSLSYAATPSTFVPTRVSTGTAPLDTSAVNCAPQAIPSATDLSPLAANTVQNAFIDGYFDVGSLVSANSGTAQFTTGSFGQTGYNDSDTLGTSKQDFASTNTITLVNTPYTDANNQQFGITAYGTTPQATLIFTSVTKPGITSALSASSVNCTAPTYDANHPAPPVNVNICLPYGKSPLPADNGAVRNLYQPGTNPQYYQLPTTATVPTGAANPTSICFTYTGGAFADTFVKPERVLLWLMANASAGTTYNSFPASFSGFTSPLAYQAGDVTSAVYPYLPSATAPSYLKVPAALTFPQVPQAQPNQVCGLVNGLTATNTADAASANAAETFGVLEPTNFPPVVVAGSIASSGSVSKGSTSALFDIYLRASIASNGVVTTKYTYDYNDSDPCYIASAATSRQTCDDNPYLYTVTFTGGNSTTGYTAPALVSTLQPESVSTAPSSSYNVATNVNLSTSTNVFVSVADQATGADAFDTDIATAPGYTGNPFVHQGNFLLANYSVASHSSQPALCDPGTSAVGGYAVTGVACPGGVGGNVSGSERYIRGGQLKASVIVNYAATQDLAGGYYVLGNIGAQSVTASNLTANGLIPLPYPSPDPSAPTTPAPTSTNPQNPGGSPSLPLGNDPSTQSTTAAIASVTAGQTAGFVWPWLSSVTQALGVPNGALPNDKYSLACELVDSATQQIPQALPAGVTCSVTTTTPTDAAASPSVFTFSNPAVQPTNGSTAPTIYITTSGSTLYGASLEPLWKRTAEGLALAMLFPALFFRKRLGKSATLAIIALLLAAAPLLSGCGTGGGGGTTSSPTGPATPAGSYLFRVTATPQSTAGGEAKITSAVFEVSVH